MSRVKHTITTVSRLCGLFAILLLIASVLAVTHMVFVRYVLVGSTIWQTEFVTYALVAATFLGGPYVLHLKGHVRVDLVENMVGPRSKRVLRLVADLCSLAFCGLIAWCGWIYFREAWAEGWTSDTVWAVPLWIPLLPMPVGFGLLCLQYIAEIVESEENTA